MKYLLMLLTAVTIFMASSCEKSVEGPIDEIENPNDTSTTPTHPDDPPVRTGLLALTDTAAVTYCVLVVYDQTTTDTLVWQNTTDDWSFSIVGSFDHDSTHSRYVAGQFKPKVVGNFKQFDIDFRKEVAGAQQPVACEWLSDMVHTGNIPLAKTSMTMNLTDKGHMGWNTFDLPSPDAEIKVLSIEKIMLPAGCYALRTRIMFKNILLGPAGCIIPPYVIKEGLVQIDYRLRG